MSFEGAIVFVHIPKTAGTSFRVAAEDYFGSERVLKDYGADSEETSQAILDTVYADGSMPQRDFRFLTGHYPASKYANKFNNAALVTFVRDPVSRVLSEFQHFVNLNGYAGSFEDFYTTEEFCDRQSRLIGLDASTDIDFVGVTDMYNESVERFNQLYGADIQCLSLNPGSYRTVAPKVAPEVAEQIIAFNQNDMALYTSAKAALSIPLAGESREAMLA